MAYRFDISEQFRVAVLTLEGHVDGRQVLEVSRAVLDDPCWAGDMRQLWDGRRVDQFVMLPSDVEALVHFYETLPCSTGRSAIVAARHEVYTIGVLMSLLLKERREIRTFASMDEALHWLGVSGNACRGTAA